MDNKVLEMFSKSSFSVSEEKYVYAKVKSVDSNTSHFMVSQDKDEITVVTEEKNISSLEVIEKNNNLWRLVSLNLFTPFMAGTLAALNTACATKGLNNLVVSTYSKDYLIVKDAQVGEIKKVLQSLGFQEK
jgi:hypothetical protein